MTPSPPHRRLGRIPSLAAVFAVFAGGLVAVGWATDRPSLTSILPGGVPMNATTAVAVVLAGLSLILLATNSTAARLAGRVLAAAVTLAGLLTLARYLFGWDSGVDTFLHRGILPESRMALNTALALALLGGALATFDILPRFPLPPAQLMAIGALVLGGLGLVGYTLSADRLLGVTGHVPMAGFTAAALTVLALGVVLARPEQGLVARLASRGPGGLLTRRLAPAAVGVPWALGWLRLRGERAGLYDAELGAAILVIATIALFLILVWTIAASLDLADADRRAAETATAAIAADFRDLYDNAPCGFHSVGPDGTIVTVNRTELAWLGYEAGEVVGRMRFAELVSPASRDAYQQGFVRVQEYGTVTDVELELVRRDGTTFPVLVSSSSVRDAAGRYVRSRTILTDLTARKQAEAEVRRLNEGLERRVTERTADLKAEEELFRGAFEHTNVAMVLTDLDNRFVRTNTAFARLFGYTPVEVLSLGMADVTHPDHMADSLDRRTALLAGGGDCFQMEKRYRHRDGREIWGLTNVALVRDAAGRPRMYVGQVQDITERKRAEKILQEHAAALETINRELVQKTAENEMFVYSVSHDLRSPLVNLQGFSKELEKGCRGLATLLADDGVPAGVRERGLALLDGRMAKAMGFIQSAVMRLSGIIDALLRLSRAGRVEYRREVVDVGRVVGRVLAAMQGTITERRATVTVSELPAARGDAVAVEQVFGNLVGNALTYLDTVRRGVIEVGCLPPAEGGDGFRTFFVRDNGLGIAEGHRGRIFHPFQRAHPGVGTGDGLGLAIVARVAERHGGRVWVESEAGTGSTFYISLPASTS